MGIERAAKIHNEEKVEQKPFEKRAAGPHRLAPERLSGGDKAAIARQEAALRKAAENVRASYRDEAIPVGRTLRETAELVRIAEAERARSFRVQNDTDDVANAYLESLGVKPSKKKQEPPKTSLKDKVLGMVKGLFG